MHLSLKNDFFEVCSGGEIKVLKQETLMYYELLLTGIIIKQQEKNLNKFIEVAFYLKRNLVGRLLNWILETAIKTKETPKQDKLPNNLDINCYLKENIFVLLQNSIYCNFCLLLHEDLLAEFRFSSFFPLVTFTRCPFTGTLPLFGARGILWGVGWSCSVNWVAEGHKRKFTWVSF